ncbi:type IV toxin-antitoxin system AbiEi family antitoxin domain-containing protein [Pseudonocardia sp.]|uniref:type IV toxin-antitoxin system AbiEi family antitoxin domain-containing protein n=1 Tax=Pseudonocardia sp. TaxID=60912 RepID=UPI003D0DB978
MITVHELLAAQDGVVSLAQAAGAGLPGPTVRRWVREGRWTRLHPAVYLAGGHRLTAAGRIRAAWLWAGEDAVVSGAAAAFWHRIVDLPPPVVDLVVPAARHPRPRPGIRATRRDLDRGADTVRIGGIRLVQKPLAVWETLRTGAGDSLFLDRALQRHVRFAAFYRTHCRHLGRPGSAAVHRMLVAAADRADSAAERLLVALLRDASLTGWVLGHPFGPYRIDLAFPALRVAVEVDGWAWHVDAERFAADRRKGNALVRAGWDLLRFTWHDLERRGPAVVAELCATLARAS